MKGTLIGCTTAVLILGLFVWMAVAFHADDKKVQREVERTKQVRYEACSSLEGGALIVCLEGKK